MSNIELRTQLRQILTTYYAESELRTLCFDLGIDYDDLAGREKRSKARELVAYCERHGKLGELIERCREERPSLTWWLDNQVFTSQLPKAETKSSSLEGATNGEEIPDLSWDEVKLLARSFTAFAFGRRYKETYRESLYVSRVEQENHLEKFISSEHRVLVITGKAGMGKSNLLCQMVQKWRLQHHTVFLEDCAFPIDLRTLPPLAGHMFCDDKFVGLTDLWLQDFARAHNIDNEKLILVFDAINEASQPHQLLEQISRSLTLHSSRFTKVIIVSRDTSWRFLKDSLTVPNTYFYEVLPASTALTVGPFTAEESLLAFEVHAAALDIAQSYDELSVQAKDFIRYPLFLGLATRIFSQTAGALPKSVSLRQLFNSYISQSIGANADDPRHLIVERMLVYLYELRQRALDVGILRNDPVVGDFIVLSGEPLPYQRLVDGGFITHQTKLTGASNEHEQAFITYERVFEYLLADLVLNPEQAVSGSEIEELLRSVASGSFPSLVGALELALGYRIVDHPEQRNLIMELAASNDMLVRQLVLDILHTIDNENAAFALEIVREMCLQSVTNIRITACNASYDLGLLEPLISLAMSKDQLVGYMASYYIYRLWDESRQQGKIEDGYKLIWRLAEQAKYPRVLRTRLLHGQRAFTALFSVSAHMLRHLLLNPEDLAELGTILGETLRSLPGMGETSLLRGVVDSVTEMLTTMGIQLVSIVALRPDVVFSNKKAMDAFFQDFANRATISKMFHVILDYPTLLGHADDVLAVMSQPHPIVPWLSAGVLIFHCLENQSHTLQTLDSIFEQSGFHGRFWITYTLEAVSIIKALEGDQSYLEVLPFLYDFALRMWEDRDSLELTELATGGQIDTTEILLLVEAIHYRHVRTQISPRFIDLLVHDIDSPLDSSDVRRILRYCELVAYQGYPDYALNLLFSDFYTYWVNSEMDDALRTLSVIRSIYREEFDAYRSRSEKLAMLWDQTGLLGAAADINALWHANANLWLIGVYSNKTLLKVAYLAVMSLVDADTTNDFFRRVVRLMLSLIRDPSQVDKLVVERHLRFTPEWGEIATWDISEATFERIREAQKMMLRRDKDSG